MFDFTRVHCIVVYLDQNVLDLGFEDAVVNVESIDVDNCEQQDYDDYCENEASLKQNSDLVKVTNRLFIKDIFI